MSFNIRFDNPHDGAHVWTARREFVASIVSDFQTDLLGTQEGRAPQLEDLSSLLPRLQMATEHRDWIEERMYPTLFYNPERFKLIDSGDIWLSETPHLAGSSSFDSAFPRLCTWARLEVSKQLEFLAINVHLDHVKEATRLAQTKVMAEEVQEIANGLPLVLMGDFNSAPQSMVRNQLMREVRGLTDPWENFGHAETASYHNFGPVSSDASRIDWFLLSPELKPKAIEFDKVNQNELWPSDHYPLKLIIDLNNHEHIDLL